MLRRRSVRISANRIVDRELERTPMIESNITKWEIEIDILEEAIQILKDKLQKLKKNHK